VLIVNDENGIKHIGADGKTIHYPFGTNVSAPFAYMQESKLLEYINSGRIKLVKADMRIDLSNNKTPKPERKKHVKKNS